VYYSNPITVNFFWFLGSTEYSKVTSPRAPSGGPESLNLTWSSSLMNGTGLSMDYDLVYVILDILKGADDEVLVISIILLFLIACGFFFYKVVSKMVVVGTELATSFSNLNNKVGELVIHTTRMIDTNAQVHQDLEKLISLIYSEKDLPAPINPKTD
jgi:hypothetical protein